MKQRLYEWLLPLTLGLSAGLIAGCGREADRMKGTWRGTVDVGKLMPQAARTGATLRLVCNIQKGSDGNLTATIDSPDQGASGLPVDTVTVKDGAFHLQLNKIFRAMMVRSARTTQITGQWKQGPNSLPLTFKKD